MSLFDALKTSAEQARTSLGQALHFSGRSAGCKRRKQNRSADSSANLESLEQRMLLTTTAINDGNWSDANTWDNGVPDEETPAIVAHGVTVELNGVDHFAKETVVHGKLVVPENFEAPTEVADGRMKLYVNGQLAGDAPASQLWKHNNGAGIGGIYNNTMTHRGIVRNKNSRFADYEGSIAKVATHNRALTGDEIDALYAESRATKDAVPLEDIASLWMFREGTTVAKDTAAGDRKTDNGVLMGDAVTTGDLVLDGDGDFAAIRNSVDLSAGVFQQKTISLWFKADNTDGTQMIYEQGGHIRGLNVYLEGDTLYAGGWNRPGRESGWQGDWISQPGIVAGEWNHVVLTLDAESTDKSLTTRWMHVNGGGEFIVGSETDRFDEGTFTLNLTGTDTQHDPVVPMRMGNGMVMQRTLTNNDGFLMTGMGGRVQFVGEEKLSFTKLDATVESGATSIVVANVIERNFNADSDIVTSAADDGELNWEVGDEIVIASTSYDYTGEEVRTIDAIVDNGDGTSTLSFTEPLEHRHYGEIETYNESDVPGVQPRSIDMRAEVALLSRNIRIQGQQSQDTDVEFGDRGNLLTTDRIAANGLSDAEKAQLPELQVANGVGGHIMFMPGSGEILVDGVQLDGLGQSSQKGRYPIHWHLGGDRTGDVFRNSSVTNSNNRGVTIHGTNNLNIEGVVVHDVHGHGFFFEDAVETGNELVGNLVLGVHAVGGKDFGFYQPGTTDPFVVDTHDSVQENRSRFSSSAAYWITNPNNTFIGNIAAGAGDQRADRDPAESGINPDKAPEAGTGFWYAIPRTAIGESSLNPDFEDYHPIFEQFGQFDHNTSHTTAIGLNFDRGSDIEDANLNSDVDFDAIHLANDYKPTVLSDPSDPDSQRLVTVNFVNNFTNYKASEAATYHRGEKNTILYRNLRVADSYNGPWAVSETRFDNSLYVGHSRGNSGDQTAEVGGPRLYDGAGRHEGAHFAGFAADSASTFQVEGSSFGPTMYHVFPRVSFEADGTYDHMAHAISDFSSQDADRGHNLGAPQQWIKAAIDVDGSLTGPAGGGAGYSIVPKVDFLVDDNDKAITPDGWDAYLTDDVYARIRIENNDDGSDVNLFPGGSEDPFIVFTADDGDQLFVNSGQNLGNGSWTQVAAKADDEGPIESTFTVEFGMDGVPEGGFVLNMKNQDGGWIRMNRDLERRVNSARIVLKVASAANYTPEGLREVSDITQLRAERSENVFYRDTASGSLYLNTGINDEQDKIRIAPTGDALQTPTAARTVQFGTVIEAEAFDNGVDGIAFHDSDGEVDVVDGKVVDIQDGEWLEYTAAIAGGAYSLGVNVSAAEAGGKIRVLAANDNSAGYLQELGTIDVPVTEDGEFETAWLDGVDLAFAEGPDSVIRLAFEGGGFEVDSVEFSAPLNQTTYNDMERSITTAAPTRIELEQFDEGGEGVAYHDTTATNDLEGNDYRTDEGVEATSTQITNQVFDGEWLEYTTDIEAGIYDISLGKNWGGDDAGVRVLIGDSNSATEFTELGELIGSGDALTLQNVDLSQWEGLGRVIRVEIVGNWMGLDWLDFTPRN
ncbi:MAG: LamG-like jellyroll fold domain-containing protein [Planctomycetaceae bacterium]